MNRKESYQERLKHLRLSTNHVSSSYSILYKGFYIFGACYNNQHICYTDINNTASFYSKSLDSVKKAIRKEYK